MSKFLAAALFFARSKGWPVLPLHTPRDGGCTCLAGRDCQSKGKHPRPVNGLKAATTDEPTIREWWGRWPGANLGIRTDGLLVIDVDSADGLAALEAEHGPLPDTVTTLTAKGRHLIFAYPGDDIGPSAGKLGPGLDVRAGSGSYIVAPPSLHASGKTYTFAPGRSPRDLDPAHSPEWLVTKLREVSRPQVAPPVEGAIPAGQRNATLTSLAGSMRRRGATQPAIEAALLAENLRCAPPLSPAEVQAIAASVARYAPAQTQVDSNESILQGADRVSPIGEIGPDEPPTSPHLTDLGNAQRLVARHGRDLRYCHAFGKWLVWSGTHWEADATGAVERMAKETVRAVYHEAGDEAGESQRKALADHAKRSESVSRLAAMIDLARSEPGIPVTPGELDRGPWLLNVANGTIDLKTGELHPHRREDLITKLAPVEFDSQAACPTWDTFLERIFSGKRSLIEFVRRAVGCSLAGTVIEHVLLIACGGGANGKGTFAEALRGAQGDYAQTMPAESLLAKREGSIPNDLARLKGARFVVASETGEGRRLDEAKVKALTGGDNIVARFLHGEFFEFPPSHTLWLTTNHRPTIKGTDYGIWRRIRLIPFTVTIPESEQDKTLGEKLRAERPGILRWAVEGCLAWQREGLGMPDEVRRATEGYQADMDLLGQFIAECCVLAPGTRAPAKELYRAYVQWAEGAGEKPLKQNVFGVSLAERGLEAKKGAGGKRLWLGIGLLAEGANSGGVAHSGADSEVFSTNLSHEGKMPETAPPSATPPLSDEEEEREKWTF